MSDDPLYYPPKLRQRATASILKAISLPPARHDDLWAGLEVLQIRREVAATVSAKGATTKAEKALRALMGNLRAALDAMSQPDMRGRFSNQHHAAIQAARDHAETEWLAVAHLAAEQKSGKYKGVGQSSATTIGLVILYTKLKGKYPTVSTDETHVTEAGDGGTLLYGEFIDFVEAVHSEFGWDVPPRPSIKNAVYSDSLANFRREQNAETN